jgi:cytochrome oxidase Cu insertion factor (SCO1/SenC/PrrC family)
MRRLNRLSCLSMLVGVGLATIGGLSSVLGYYQVGDSVGNFTLTNWNGQQISLYDYTDRFVFLNFWYATGS